MLKADLHTHTTWSDGALAPRELLRRANEKLLTHIAICDHDTVAALDSLRPRDVPMDVTLVPGVEVSAWLADREVHILGLGVDIRHPRLRRTLGNLLEHRQKRMGAMFDLLVRNGAFRRLDDDAREALRSELVERPDHNDDPRGDPVGAAACRLHLVSAMLRHGVASSIPEAFDRWIGDGRPAFVPSYRYAGDEAIAMLREAGGVPVLAHPGSYREQCRAAIRAAAAAGIGGIELVHPRHNAAKRKVILETSTAVKLDLFTGGSDYHNDASHHAWRFGNTFSPPEHLDALFDQMACRRFEPAEATASE
ncbi:MAG: PHP domain-containing protein [Planctomycetota bacterium]